MLNFNNTYATLDPRLYHKQPPTPLLNPQAGHFNPLVAAQIGWSNDPELMQNWVQIIGGAMPLDGSEPLAMAYAGHQFGQWAGQLGDGRGLLLGQVIDSQGQLTDLHLKGAGLTPYSRMGDGRAVIRSVVREYLAGHALNQLGIHASNAVGFVISDSPVMRETRERGAALLRTADTHIRFGHFEWIANFAPDLLMYFTRYVIRTYFPESAVSDTPIQDFLRAVVKATATTIADWQLVGFAHGVMNTDNLSITGTTIDFGPYGFMERFNPLWINNHSDYQGRYTYQNQPSIGLWNLSRLISLFLRLNDEAFDDHHQPELLDRETLTAILDEYSTLFYQHYEQGLCQKFGLETNEHNFEIATQYLEMMQVNRLDYTNSLRALVAIAAQADGNEQTTSYQHEYQLLADLNQSLTPDAVTQFDTWQQDYCNRLHAQSLVQLQAHNPAYVLRNSMAQQAIERAEVGDMAEVERLFKLLTSPYEVSEFAKPTDTLPPNLDTPEICVSCSS